MTSYESPPTLAKEFTSSQNSADKDDYTWSPEIKHDGSNSEEHKACISDRGVSLQDSPILDIIALVLSAGILLAVVGLLQRYDGKKQPDWKHLSLNTVIAWFSTLSKGCIVLLLGRSMGQLKWVWFVETRRPLADLRTFDMASRGFLGSTILLFKQKGRHLASIGCIAVILSFAFEPFVQNLVHYVSVSVEDSFHIAHLANTSIYKTVGPGFNEEYHRYPDPVLKANVYAALLNLDAAAAWSVPQYNCASGNCTWEPIDFLSAGYYCTDLTSNLELYCNESDRKVSFGGLATECEVSLPRGPHLRFSRTPFTGGTIFTMATKIGHGLAGPYSANENEKFPLAKTRYIRAMDVNVKAGPMNIHLSNSTKWTAKECVLYPGVRRVSTRVSNGKYNDLEHDIYDEKTGRSVKIWSAWQNFFNYKVVDDALFVGLQPPPWPENSNSRNRTTMGLFLHATYATQLLFEQLFHGSVAQFSDNLGFFTGIGNEAQRAMSSASAGAAQDVLEAIVYRNLVGCEPDRDPVECAMENTAKALTKSFRDAAYVQHGYEKANMTIGNTLVDETRVTIQWPWLIVPVLVWLLSVGLWSTTVWRTWKRDIPMWRNNPLPLLLLYRPIDKCACQTDGKTSSLAYTRRMRRVLGQLYASKDVKEPRIE